jgi:hypothetical protein
MAERGSGLVVRQGRLLAVFRLKQGKVATVLGERNDGGRTSESLELCSERVFI